MKRVLCAIFAVICCSCNGNADAHSNDSATCAAACAPAKSTRFYSYGGYYNCVCAPLPCPSGGSAKSITPP